MQISTITSWSILVRRVAGALFCTALLTGTIDAEDDAESVAAKAKANADATTILLLDPSPRTPRLVPKPLLSYADNPRGIHDARLWLLEEGQRPAVLLKTESMTERGRPKWVYCISSWSSSRVKVTLPGGREWTSSKPGVEWKPLPTGITPAETPLARLRQLKDIARRFASTSFDDNSAAGAQEMRLLNQPLHRYSAPDDGVIDAAMFGLTNNGTNPDLVFAVEIVRGQSGRTEWRFAASQMTSARLQLRLDGKEAWTAPYVWTTAGKLHDQERWMFCAEYPTGGAQP